MNILKRLQPETLGSKSSVAIIVTVAFLLELIFLVEYFFARKGIPKRWSTGLRPSCA